MSDDTPRIVRVRTATILHRLAVPILYGDWVMKHREFALVRIDADDGTSGFAYDLTRDGPIAQIVARSISPQYLGAYATAPADRFYRALWSSHAVHAAGIGMRALSLVDIAAWDLAAKIKKQSIETLLTGGRKLESLPATAIVGYPPSMSAEETGRQIEGLLAEGWTRFKLPIAPDLDLSVARLEAAREVAPDAWIGFDANMVFRSAQEVADFDQRVAHLRLGWIEDLVPPGDARLVADARALATSPVAMGDEQGGSYHPQALLDAGAVDFLRIDATTNGGVTRWSRVLGQAEAAGVPVTPHMFPHLHSRLVSAYGVDAPVEWGIPGTGVHPMDDELEQPVIHDGRMELLSEEPGFGVLVNPNWINRQEVQDPDRLLDDLE